MRPRFFSIIGRYVFRELFPPFFVNMALFSFIFLLTQILEITKMVVNYKVEISSILWMLLYSMPYFLIYIIPMSVMTAVLLAFLRMSADNEITALKSVGVGIHYLLPPVLVFCIMGSILTASMTFFGLPWGRLNLKQSVYKIVSSNISLGLKERTFNDIGGVMFYVNRIDIGSNALRDVFLEDRRNDANVMIVAPKGRIAVDRKQYVIRMRLFDGVSSRVDIERKRVNTTHFKDFEVRIDLPRPEAMRRRGTDELMMTFPELVKFIRERKNKDSMYYEALIEYHRKFAVPLACIFLGILALPLGLQSKQARKTAGIGLAIGAFTVYYLLMAAGKVFGEDGSYPPAIGMWMPNIVCGVVGIYLFVRTIYEGPFLVGKIRMLRYRIVISRPPGKKRKP